VTDRCAGAVIAAAGVAPARGLRNGEADDAIVGGPKLVVRLV
jgi:hypothetical protein